MGLLSLFIKSPEDIEKKGDKLVLDEMYGPARMEYGKALEKLESKGGSPETLARIEEKYAQCGEFLARQHLAEAADLHEAGIDAEAHHLLFLAQKLALEEDTKAKISELLGKLKSSMAQEGEEWEEEAVDETPDHDESAFMALCMSLGEEQGDAYMEYGDAFRDGYIALNEGRFEEAEMLLRGALEEEGEGSYVPLELAAACINTGKGGEAIELLSLFLEHHPGHDQGIELLCHLLAESGDILGAMAKLDAHLETAGEVAISHAILKARFLISVDKKDEADAWLDSRLDDGWDDHIAYMLATIRKDAGDIASAKKLLETSVGRCSGCGRRPSSFVSLALADLRAEEGDTSSKLIETYLKIAMEDPSVASQAYASVSQIYRSLGNEKEASRYADMT